MLSNDCFSSLFVADIRDPELHLLLLFLLLNKQLLAKATYEQIMVNKFLFTCCMLIL